LPADQAGEYLMMGLRVKEGIDPGRYAEMAGHALPQDRLCHLEGLGLIEVDANSIRATQQGRIVLNSVLVELIGE